MKTLLCADSQSVTRLGHRASCVGIRGLADLRKALAAASHKAREVWSDITPAARRDFVHWITSGKRAKPRTLRIEKACDMLAKGKCRLDRGQPR
jgi:hypothetical protein